MITEIDEDQEEEKLKATTRLGNNIRIRTGLLTLKSVLDAERKNQETVYPDKSLYSLRKEGGPYNCHGLTFLNRRGFLHPKHIPLILSDDDYEIVTIEDLKPGDIAVYRGLFDINGTGEIQHTGIVTFVQRTGRDGAALIPPVVWVVSKWGKTAEYIHKSDYGPYGHYVVSYMREGKYDKPRDI